MIFIGGISSGMKPIEYLKTVICGRCGAYGRYQVYMTYMYFSFFFIPLFKWNRRFYVKMSCCGAVYELDPEVGRRLLRGENLEIRETDLTLVQDGGGNPWAAESERNALRRRAGMVTERTAAGTGQDGPVKKCGSCGFETQEDYAYCPRCGTPLDMEIGERQ